jgi:hypothetical protein
MRRRRQLVSNEITITRVANGWAVRMPEQYEPQEDPSDVAHAMAEGMKSMKPFIKEMVGELHKDPLLDKLQGGDQQDPETDDLDEKLQELAQPVIGRDESIYVFSTFNDVLNHLNRCFVDEDGE